MFPERHQIEDAQSGHLDYHTGFFLPRGRSPIAWNSLPKGFHGFLVDDVSFAVLAHHRFPGDDRREDFVGNLFPLPPDLGLEFEPVLTGIQGADADIEVLPSSRFDPASPMVNGTPSRQAFRRAIGRCPGTGTRNDDGAFFGEVHVMLE